MASTQRFFSAAGNIIPSSIFDKGDAEMDVSEEAEEMRELLYELIKNQFPKGVTATHLAEKYVSCGMGLPLPDNWLRQVAAAEEFEVQQRGPISILFIRLKDEPPRLSAALPIVDPAQTGVSFSQFDMLFAEFTSAAPKVEAPKIKVVSPLDIAKKLRPQRVDVGGSPRAVVVSATPNRARPLYLRPVDVEPRLALLRKEMKEHYGSGDHPRLEDSEIHVGGAYAVEDLNGDWLRVALTATHADRTVDARWLDGGSRTGYPRSALRRLDEKWTGDSWPLAAVAVSLVLPDAAWSHPDLVKQLTRLVFDNDAQGNLTPTGLSARFVREVKNQEWAFEVELQTSKGVKIAEDLLSALGIEASSQPVKPILAEDSKPVTPQIWSAASPTPTTTSSTGGVDFDAAFDIVPLPVEAMPRGVFQAHALFASGPADMTLRQASLDPMPDYLYQRLALESETPEAKLKSGEPVVSGCYAARVDGRWERVRCVRASNIDRQAFCVYLVDVGAFHYVRGDELRRLNARSPFTKMLCFKCKLYGVRPVGGMDVWSREAQLLIGEALAANAGRPLEVTPRGSWSTWKQHNAPAVPLIEASLRVADVDLAEALLRVGLAVKAVKDPN